MNDELEKYKDIIDLPHHVSKDRRHMPLIDRAAQFAPFAALTGFEDDVDETERLTDDRTEITEDALNELNERLTSVIARIGSHPEVEFGVFMPDDKKAGGSVVRIKGCLKRYDEIERKLILNDGRTVSLDDIVSISETDE